MLSRCPGSAKRPVRTTRPHPVLLFHTDSGLLCVSSLPSTMWGVAWDIVAVGGICFFSLFLSLSHSLGDPCPLPSPKMLWRGDLWEQSWKIPGRA